MGKCGVDGYFMVFHLVWGDVVLVGVIYDVYFIFFHINLSWGILRNNV